MFLNFRQKPSWPLRLLPLMSVLVVLSSCKEDVLPKPKAELRLEYPNPEPVKFDTDYFSFRYNGLAKVKNTNASSLTLEYPEMKGEIFINYKSVETNLQKLLSDAQKFSYEHSVKADGILEQPFINSDDKVYGMFYEVSGDAASQAQFYVTDSTEHFVTGSLYFYTKPNYDSIYPAAVYLRKDIRAIMESLQWK
ncbi:gliding motility lipoprotein GldD [Euzebyella marina]|uniref:Gliding motility lipoprotein GldD n=1 Tax=Euzebyella marina TaxID=1761453 RepID=A0A3G2LB19_9FLAO|nr:gliding motility lipoprotein GldD [Euzebyella marina]AYN69455.1 gliding motility lipoprotein GldD [Euzebyella marina]